MTPTQREAALRWAERHDDGDYSDAPKLVAFLRELAAEPQGEPVAMYSPCCQIIRIGVKDSGTVHDGLCREKHGGELGPTLLLYTHPPQRKPLSDEQIDAVIRLHVGSADLDDEAYASAIGFARAIEAAHGILPHNKEKSTP